MPLDPPSGDHAPLRSAWSQPVHHSTPTLKFVPTPILTIKNARAHLLVSFSSSSTGSFRSATSTVRGSSCPRSRGNEITLAPSRTNTTHSSSSHNEQADFMDDSSSGNPLPCVQYPWVKQTRNSAESSCSTYVRIQGQGHTRKFVLQAPIL